MLALAWVGTCRSLPLPGQKPSGASQALCHPGAAPRSRSFPAAPSAPSPRVPRDRDWHGHPWGPVAIQPGRRGLSAVLAPWRARLLFPCRAAGRGRDPCLRGNTLRISPWEQKQLGGWPWLLEQSPGVFSPAAGRGLGQICQGGLDNNHREELGLEFCLWWRWHHGRKGSHAVPLGLCGTSRPRQGRRWGRSLEKKLRLYRPQNSPKIPLVGSRCPAGRRWRQGTPRPALKLPRRCFLLFCFPSPPWRGNGSLAVSLLSPPSPFPVLIPKFLIPLRIPKGSQLPGTLLLLGGGRG